MLKCEQFFQKDSNSFFSDNPDKIETVEDQILKFVNKNNRIKVVSICINFNECFGSLFYTDD